MAVSTVQVTRRGSRAQDSRDITDDEKESDSDFMEGLDKIVYFEDMDQKYKGANINYTGKIKGLSK